MHSQDAACLMNYHFRLVSGRRAGYSAYPGGISSRTATGLHNWRVQIRNSGNMEVCGGKWHAARESRSAAQPIQVGPTRPRVLRPCQAFILQARWVKCNIQGYRMRLLLKSYS